VCNVSRIMIQMRCRLLQYGTYMASDSSRRHKYPCTTVDSIRFDDQSAAYHGIVTRPETTNRLRVRFRPREQPEKPGNDSMPSHPPTIHPLLENALEHRASLRSHRVR